MCPRIATIPGDLLPLDNFIRRGSKSGKESDSQCVTFQSPFKRSQKGKEKGKKKKKKMFTKMSDQIQFKREQ